MKVIVLAEEGMSPARIGLSLSFYDHQEDLKTWWGVEKIEKANKRMQALAFRNGGHNKFLESLQVWVFIQATRGFWQEFDTYRVGITKQSASTMHTLDKREVTAADFEVGTSAVSIAAFNTCLMQYKDPESEYFKDITRLKENLPEGWLQERIVNTNYKVLQNMVAQREKHRYKHWRTFVEELKLQLKYSEFIFQD